MTQRWPMKPAVAGLTKRIARMLVVCHWVTVSLVVGYHVTAGASGGSVVAFAQEAAGLQDRRAVILLNTAGRLYRQENWRDAARSYEDFLQQFPEHPDVADARFARGYCLNRLEQHAEAAKEFRAATQRSDASWITEAHFYLGRSLEALADAGTADTTQKKEHLLAAAQAYGDAARLRGEVKAGDDKEALDFKVLAVTSQGEVLYAAGAYAEADEALQPLFDAEAQCRDSKHFVRGIYALALARYTIAEEKPRSEGAGPDHTPTLVVLELLSGEAFGDDPLWFEATFLRARLLHQREDWEDAIVQYGRVADRGGQHAEEASFHRALATYELAGDPDRPAEQRPDDLRRAADACTEFLQFYPESSFANEARFYRGLSFFEGERYTDARTDFEGVASGGGELAGLASLRLGQCLVLQKEPDPAAAERACREAAEALAATAAEGTTLQKGTALEQLAEAIYWRGEALLLRDERLPPDALEQAAKAFGEVAENHRATVPALAEKALYQQARAHFLASQRREAAAAASLYRERYPQESGLYYAESLQLSAENAFRARPGELDSAERSRAASYYAAAARAARQEKQSYRLRYLSGVAAYTDGDYPGAAETLGKLREDLGEVSPASFDAVDLPFFLGDSLAQQSRFRDAGTGETGSNELDPAERQRLERAVGLFQEYLVGEDQVHVQTARVNVGLCQQRLGDHAAARKTFETFTQAYPDHPSAPQVRFELANVYLVLEERELAAEAYRQAALTALESESVSISDDDRQWVAAQALLQSAKLRRLLFDLQAALDAFDRLPLLPGIVQTNESEVELPGRLRPVLIEAHYERSTVLSEVDRKDEARSELAKHLALFPESPFSSQTRVQLAQLLLDEKAPREALTVLDPLLKADGPVLEQDQAFYISAWCHGLVAESERETEASAALERTETAYRRLINEYPQSELLPEAMLELGQRLFNRKAYTEAREYFGRVVAYFGEGPWPASAEGASEGERRAQDLGVRSLYGLAYAFFEEEAYVDARGYFDRVTTHEDGELMADALYRGARSWMLSGGDEEASKRFERFVESFPESAHREEALLRLGECYHKLQLYDKAIATLETQLREFPDGTLRHDGRFALGFAQQFSDQFEAAVENYRQVVAETQLPVAARSQYHIGECFMDIEKPREAAREFLTVVANFDFEGEEEAVEKYLEWVRRALLSGGMAYDAAGDEKAADAQYRELAQRFPGSDAGKAAAKRLAGREG